MILLYTIMFHKKLDLYIAKKYIGVLFSESSSLDLTYGLEHVNILKTLAW